MNLSSVKALTSIVTSGYDAVIPLASEIRSRASAASVFSLSVGQDYPCRHDVAPKPSILISTVARAALRQPATHGRAAGAGG